MSIEIPECIQGFVAQIPEASAVNAVNQFLSKNLIPLDIGVYEDFIPSVFWSSSRERADGRKAHSWFFLREWSSAVGALEKGTKLSLVRSLMEALPAWKLAADEQGTMAYHDETTAQRTINTCVFIRNYAEEIEELGFTELIELNSNNISLLTTAEFYGGLNNHGMFQDIAILVAYALGFASEENEDVAITRLTEYFDRCFTEDGIHTENNPTYHVMVSRSLSQVANYLRLTEKTHNPQELERLIEKADLFAAYCVLPNLEFPPISDTKLEKLSVQRARSIYGNENFVGAITSGTQGKLPTSLNYVAARSGYAVFRSGWDKNSRFAMFSAAYNANYHKHSDELSIFVYANGHSLLAEAGPNGYQYSDPFTAYAFSSFAHNTLIVDDKGLPRVDNKAHLTTMHEYSETDVEGRTLRFEGVDWKRRVNADGWASEGQLKITDHIKCDGNRNLKVLWHLGPETVPIIRGSIVEIFSKSTNVKLGELYMEGTAVDTVRAINAEQRPRVQGFSFPEMGKKVPAWVVQFEFNTKEVDVKWDFRTENFQVVDRGITPKSSLWKTFHGEKPVRYLLDKPVGANNALLFVFSAVSKNFDFTYNYRASLADFQGTVCYIIDDFGDQGSYYLANGRNFSEFRSVQQAMAHIANEANVPLSEAYATGSSKGGAGAIMHGVTAGVKHVLAGGPQYKIGSFTKTPHPNILKYISGGNSDEDIEWADSAMRAILAEGHRDTRISVIVGKADGHHRKHAVPLSRAADELGYQMDLLPLPGTTHAELGPVFRRAVNAFGRSIVDDSGLLPHVFAVSSADKKVGLAIIAPAGALVLAQLQLNGKPIGKAARISNGVMEWEVESKGVYRARVYFEQTPGAPRVAFGTEPIRLE